MLSLRFPPTTQTKFWPNYEKAASSQRIIWGYGYIWELTQVQKISSWKLLLGMVIRSCSVDTTLFNYLHFLTKLYRGRFQMSRRKWLAAVPWGEGSFPNCWK
jgi:hypothetical protein